MKEYTPVKPVDPTECGRNKSATIVTSKSKNVERTKKWIHKTQSEKYPVHLLVNEVLMAQILVALFTKNYAAKSKIDFKNFGSVSRILANDSQDCEDLFHFINSRFPDRVIKLSGYAASTLFRALCAKLVLHDRDIKFENFVVVYDKISKQPLFIYAIDHEFCLQNRNGIEKTIKTNQFLKNIAQNPRLFAYTLIDDTNGWSHGTGRYAIETGAKDWYVSILGLEKLTAADIFAEIFKIATALIADNDKLIDNVVAKITTAINENHQALDDKVKYHILGCLNIQSMRVKTHASAIVNFLSTQVRPNVAPLVFSTTTPAALQQQLSDAKTPESAAASQVAETTSQAAGTASPAETTTQITQDNKQSQPGSQPDKTNTKPVTVTKALGSTKVKP